MKDYALSIIIQTIDNEKYIILEKRARTLRAQPSEICLPGGNIENGESSIMASVRESIEELNLDIDKLYYTGKMCEFSTFANNVFHIFLFTYSDDNKLTNYNRDEVDSLIYYPVNKLMASVPEEYNLKVKYEFEKDFPFSRIPNGENYEFRNDRFKILFYHFETEEIWGLTAKILNRYSKWVKEMNRY